MVENKIYDKGLEGKKMREKNKKRVGKFAGILIGIVMLTRSGICANAATPYYYELNGDCYRQDDEHGDYPVEKKTVYVTVSDAADENEYNDCVISIDNRKKALQIHREDGYDEDCLVYFLLTIFLKSEPNKAPAFTLTVPFSEICSTEYDVSSVELISQEGIFENPKVTTDGTNIIVKGKLTAIYEPYQNEFLLGFKKMASLPQGVLQPAEVSVVPTTMSDGEMFDAEYYAINNPDVAGALGTDANVLYEHYKSFGTAEGRKPYENAVVK